MRHKNVECQKFSNKTSNGGGGADGRFIHFSAVAVTHVEVLVSLVTLKPCGARPNGYPSNPRHTWLSNGLSVLARFHIAFLISLQGVKLKLKCAKKEESERHLVDKEGIVQSLLYFRIEKTGREGSVWIQMIYEVMRYAREKER